MRNWVKTTISGPLLKDFLTEGNIVMARCKEGLPEEAAFIRSYIDPYKDELVMVWEHRSFKAVPENGLIPERAVWYDDLAGISLRELMKSDTET